MAYHSAFLSSGRSKAVAYGYVLIACYLFLQWASQPLWAAPAVSLTSAEQGWLKQQQDIVVGGGPDWAPFDFVDDDGQYQGVANDILQLIGEKTGLNFVVAVDTWSGNLKKIQNRKIDLLGAVYHTAERENYLAYSKPYFEVLDYFFIRDDVSAQTLEDLNGKRVAIPDQYAHGVLLKKYYPEIKIVTVATFGDAVDAVLEGRAEILFDTYAAISHALKREGISTIVAFKSTRHLGVNPLHIVTHKDAVELISIVQKGLDAISEEEYQNIYYRWLGPASRAGGDKIALTALERTWLQNNPVVAVGGSPDWTPFNFADEKGGYKGIASDYLQLIAERTGLSFDVTIAPWSESLQNLRDNKIDLLGAVYDTEERRRYLNFSKPYFEVLDFFFIRDDIDAQTLADLSGKRVAIPKGYAHIGFLKDNFPALELVLVDTFGEAIDAVLERRAELLYDTYGSLIYTIESRGINTIIPFKSTRHLGEKYIHIATRKQLPELASIVQKGLDAISEVERRAISQRWLGSRVVESGPDKNLEMSTEEQLWLSNNPVVRFAGDPNWLPYEAFNDENKYIGIVAEYLALIEKKLGISFEMIQTNSWSESVEKVRQGEIDVLSETSDSDLKTHLNFTQHYVSSPLVIIMNKEAGYVDGIEQIENKSIALIKDYGYVPKIVKSHPGIMFKRVASIQQGLTEVSTGRVDALVATLAQASFHISNLGMNNIRIVGQTEFETQLAFGVRKELPHLLALLDRALLSITPDEKQQIMSKWGKHKYIEKINYQLLFQVAIGLLLVILFTLYWNRKLSKEVGLRKVAEEQTRILIDKIPLQIVVTSYDGHILSANPQALDDHQVSEAEMGEYNIMDFYINKSDRDSVINEIKDKGMVEQKIVSMRGVNREVRKMMLSITPIVYLKEPALLSIAVDLTNRLEFEDTLAKAKEYAETASRAKSEFLANMSHEIRTPMNAILGFTGLLMDQVDDPKLKSFVNTIQTAGKNLLVLINDILDLSKIEAGKLSIEKTPCNPADQFQELNDIFSLKAGEKGITLIFDVDPRLPSSLQLDAVRLRQVLFNLLGNAIKFTDQGVIRIQLKAENEDEARSKVDLIINVEDSGIGISQDQQSLIFEEFAQSSAQDSRKYGGTGLGLSISKRLVEMMGGSLTLESVLGKGSIFTVKLPGVDIASMMALPTFSSDENLHCDEFVFLPARILIVDDVDDNRALLQANFAATELIVESAENGLEALRQFKERAFELVLMDLRMPVMNGYEAAEEIKKISNVPIVALTASVMLGEFSPEENPHFDGYLRKPVSRSELFIELAKYLPVEAVTLETSGAKAKRSNESLEMSLVDATSLPFIVAELETLSDHYKTIVKGNNISEISSFADALLEINERYPCTPLNEFARELLEKISRFDIPSIKRAMNTYPQLCLDIEALAA